MKAYIAGPMRGYKRFNFDTFYAAEAWLATRLHFEVVNPARHDLESGALTEDDVARGVLPDGFDLAATMAWDLAQVRSAAYVYVLPGWEQSVGARREILEAQRHEIPVVEMVPCAEGWDLVTLWSSGHEWVVPEPTDVPADTNGEVRIVNEETGGAKGQKLARFDLIPWDAMWSVAEHYGVGARKYEDRNWERGYSWSLSTGALGRHFAQFCAGQDIDEETGSPHLAAVVFHALALLRFGVSHPEMDDRSGA